jgi:hypothetical protein
MGMKWDRVERERRFSHQKSVGPVLGSTTEPPPKEEKKDGQQRTSVQPSRFKRE